MRSLVIFPLLIVAVLAHPARAEDDATLQALFESWKGGDETALDKLRELGPEASSLAPQVIQSLVDLQEDEEDGSAGLLGAMQADGVPAIIRYLEDEYLEVKLIHLLRGPGRTAREAGDTLLKLAVEGPGDFHEPALAALAAVGVKQDYLVPELIRLLRQPHPPSRMTRVAYEAAEKSARFATDLLGKQTGKMAQEGLFWGAQSHPNPVIRAAAFRALVGTGEVEPDERMTWVLFGQLDDHGQTSGTGSTVASDALMGLFKYDRLPKAAGRELVSRLYRMSFEPHNGWSAHAFCDAICRCSEFDRDATELIRQKLQPFVQSEGVILARSADEKLQFRVAAASVVLKSDPANAAAAEFLAKIAASKPEVDVKPGWGRALDVRAQAARGLGRIGPAARRWLPLLHRIMAAEVDTVPRTELAFDSALAIARIDPEDQECLKVLRTSEHELSFQRMPWRRFEAVLGPRAAKLTDIDAVLENLKTAENLDPLESDNISRWVKWRPHHAAIAPVLIDRLGSEETGVRRSALKALSHLDVQSQVLLGKRVVPRVADALRDPRAVVRATAARTLEAFGPAAVDAIPALEAAKQDPYRTVRFAAEDALATIRGKKAQPQKE